MAGSFLGVGMTAYSRIAPAYFLDRYRIIALRKTKDLPLLRGKVEVFCLEEELGRGIDEERYNSARLLSHPLVRAYIAGLPGPIYLLIYQSYPELEALAGREKWKLLANPASLRMEVGERSFFQKMLKDLRLNAIRGHLSPIEAIFSDDYSFWTDRMDSHSLVVRLPEVLQGGGRGIFFIHSEGDYQQVRQRLQDRMWRGILLKYALIQQFVEGTPVSLSLCLTRYGMVNSRLQRQLIDLPHCHGLPEDGIFCGHSWSRIPWSPLIISEITRQSRLMGDYLAALGYKGILGIDFLIGKEDGEVYALECNPRYTGAFPMLSQLHLEHGLLPLDLFHILEFLDEPYAMDTLRIQQGYESPFEGSHIILFSLIPGIRIENATMEAGLYEWDEETGGVTHLGPALAYSQMRHGRQFIVIDGPPDSREQGIVYQDPLQRICRILFPFAVLDEKGGGSSRASRIVEEVYGRLFPLRPVSLSGHQHDLSWGTMSL